MLVCAKQWTGIPSKVYPNFLPCAARDWDYPDQSDIFLDLPISEFQCKTIVDVAHFLMPFFPERFLNPTSKQKSVKCISSRREACRHTNTRMSKEEEERNEKRKISRGRRGFPGRLRLPNSTSASPNATHGERL